MNRLISIVALAGLAGMSAQAFADDSPKSDSGMMKSDSAMTSSQMKDCMAKQKAANSSMTHAAMETVCKNEMKNPKKSGNDLATGTQAPKPQE